jgi:hypothetical protein
MNVSPLVRHHLAPSLRAAPASLKTMSCSNLSSPFHAESNRLSRRSMDFAGGRIPFDNDRNPASVEASTLGVLRRAFGPLGEVGDTVLDADSSWISQLLLFWNAAGFLEDFYLLSEALSLLFWLVYQLVWPSQPARLILSVESS